MVSFLQRHKWSPDVTRGFIAKIRPHILIHNSQRQMLEKFYLLVTNSEVPGNGG